ncbi:putative P-loop ATPase [Spirosoma lacussanchae]|uniref:VapE domain-containing protein n=1 Tax=Spirosoma lacussanchae TaxID=1884249 RepID=UPI0011098372|nr:VapE domain-containing protein [Spirosoma lacussanchae]
MSNTTETRLIGHYKDRSTVEGVDITVQDFFDGIRSGARWKRHAEWVREALDDKKEYDRRKSLSECVTIGGTFTGKKEINNLREASGLLAADLDHLNERTEAIRFQLSQDPYVYAVFVSIGGKGLCVIFRIDSGRWAESFQGIADYMISNYGLVGKEFDPSSSNINRLRYISHDPDLYHNPKAKLFNKYPRKEKKEVKKTSFIDTEDDLKHILDQIHARGIDIAPGYNEWYKVGWALISKYGDGARSYFHEISQYHPDYNSDDCDKKFKYLTDTRPARITISTFYYYCRLAGLDIMTPKTREIVSVAAMSKKQKVSKSSAMDTVLKMVDGAERTAAEPIIDQVYASSEPFETSETLFDQLELFLNKEYPMRRNEITRYIEDEEGHGLVDDDFNSIWIHSVKVLGEKVTDKMVNKLIHSSFTKTYNPLKDFFTEHRHRRPTGCIKALAESIETSTGLEDDSFFPDYAEFIIRKWLLGLISSIFDEHCPLVLVLTGKKGSGKTEWFRRLLPRELHHKYFAETTWPVGKDTDMLMCENLITFNDEWKGKTVKDPETLKGYASIDRFTLREPYGKAFVKRRRLALMCGTSNPTQIIADPDNNRKIVAINVTSVNHELYNAVDKTDLLMEAYHAYMAGERHHLTRAEMDRIAEEVNGFEDYSTEHNLLVEYVRMPTGAGGEDVQRLSAVKIMTYLENKANNRKLSEALIGRELAAMGFEKKRYRGEGSKRYYAYEVVLEG